MIRELIIAFIGSLPAILVSLWIERERLPSLRMTAGEDANSDNTYPLGHPHAGERWKFTRLFVENRPFPPGLSWIPRQTAESCRAKIEFQKGAVSIGAMDGRWASSPELPMLQNEALLRLTHPDPVTIPAGSKEVLDVITQNSTERVAYGWNNEAYFNNWRTPRLKLAPGTYLVKVTVTSQNGRSRTQLFDLVVDEDITKTQLQSTHK